ncbi:MAG: hypothetical protein AB7P50_04160 [Alphaproteobacteria bacterium]
MRRVILLVLALTLAGGALTACGKKGPPRLPEGESDQYPRTYPKGAN